jgi:hypothetical protein
VPQLFVALHEVISFYPKRHVTLQVVGQTSMLSFVKTSTVAKAPVNDLPILLAKTRDELTENVEMMERLADYKESHPDKL